MIYNFYNRLKIKKQKPRNLDSPAQVIREAMGWTISITGNSGGYKVNNYVSSGSDKEGTTDDKSC